MYSFLYALRGCVGRVLVQGRTAEAHFRPIIPMSYEEYMGTNLIVGSPVEENSVKNDTIDFQDEVGLTGMKNNGTLLVIDLGC